MKILVVEDEADIAEAMARALNAAGFAVDRAADGVQGEFLGSTERYAAAVLDLGLPGLKGIEVLRRWRGSGAGFPVLILTARGEWADKVAGFRAGADDYVMKPIRMEEVVLRLQALIRRSAGHAAAEIRAGRLAFDMASGLAALDGMPLKLTAFEAKILRYLMLHKGRLVGRAELSEQMYETDADPDFRSMEVVIGRLRRKIGEGRIETRRGEGYRLSPEDPA